MLSYKQNVFSIVISMKIYIIKCKMCKSWIHKFKRFKENRLIVWRFGYHTFKYTLPLDLIVVSFMSVGRVVAFGAAGTVFNPSPGICVRSTSREYLNI
jgi:hypothetical protein